MATFLISVTSILVLWVAATFSTSASAMRDLVKVDNYIDSPTTEVVPAASAMNHDGGQRNVDKPAPVNCSPQDISITQKQVSSSGIPRFEVSIVNTCIDHSCSIRNIIALCGQFSSATPIDPKVWRRVGNGPTCIVNNLNPMSSGQMLTFHYDTEFIEPLRLSSAEPVCSH